ncbi:hypothetical protein HHK36_004043 [Tetracentron sinense]|uniref:Nitrate regulatory gene2 protein n=1 Tax=Tetracentron sinense TaxID=13715 RepID=A0A834ZQG1_TETSI|nr:hypothetical protein HHK36_004043 [Tetracentron sinense]
MGCSSSRYEKDEALRLCKERMRFIKQAIDSRHALAAAHQSYIQSLRNIGIGLRRFAEAEVVIESILSTSATELDRTPSHSSYPSPSPSHNAETFDSPPHNERESPLSPPLSTLSYMKSGGSAAVTVRISPPSNSFIDGESLTFLPPPPPPPPETGFSWDFFDPTDQTDCSKFIGQNGFVTQTGSRQFRGEEVVSYMEEGGKKWENVCLKGNGEVLAGSVRPELEQRAYEMSGNSAIGSKGGGLLAMDIANSIKGFTLERFEDAQQAPDREVELLRPDRVANGSAEALAVNAALEQSSSKKEKTASEKDLCAEREDPSEFITHRAKDFLSSIKDIEHRFFRASESGKEISRMLESNQNRLSHSAAKGRSPLLVILAAFHLVCCQGETIHVPHEPPQHVKRVITWNRSASSQSSSSKNPLATASKDDINDSGSDFVEEFCMIAGSHSSTLDRLYAWERKLYDEVKASESIRKEYDQKCDQLRHQFAKDLSPQVIDKTRAVIKDLHSRIRVAIHVVDSISKRIEKLRDEELQPQLVELIQGLIRMWKAMLECHHTQYITISLAYHSKSSVGTPQGGDTHRQVIAQLQHEIECFGSSFADWVNAHKSYVESFNGWLQNCILQPQERSKGRRAFSPRRALAPPIFVLSRDLSVRMKALPSGELTDAIKSFLSDLRHLMGQQVEEQRKKQGSSQPENNGESESKQEEKYDRSLDLNCIHKSLTKALDRLTKFAEASLKMYEDIQKGSEAARIAYTNCSTARFWGEQCN